MRALRRTHRRLAAAALAAALAHAAPLAAAPIDTAKAVIDARRIPSALVVGRQFDVSADGRRLAYVTAEPTSDGAAYAVSLWITDTQRPERAQRVARLADMALPYPNLAPRFSPDGRHLAYLDRGGIVLAPLDGGPDRLIRTERPPLRFAWSPDGRTVAAIIPPAAEPEPTGGMEIAPGWPFADSGPGSSLVLVDLASGQTRSLTGPDFAVSSLSWAPDGHSIAIAAAPVSSRDRASDQDIYLVDVPSGATRAVVRQAGTDSNPAFSPDGRRIAFATQAGDGVRDGLQALGVYDLSDRHLSFPAREAFRTGPSTPHDLTWRDARHLDFTAGSRLTSPVLEVNVTNGRLRRLDGDGLAYAAGLARAAATGDLVFARETLSDPGDLWILQQARRAPERVTRLNPDLRLPPIETSVVSWPSADGRFTVEGLLIRPANLKTPAPLVTLIEGGPEMVHVEFNAGLQYPIHALAESGFAVFVPNTRGRSGYGEAFRRAIRDEKDYVGGPFSDLMSGVDSLVASGVADPHRLGVAGFSYGAYLTAHAITHTDHFTAAALNDVRLDLARWIEDHVADPDYMQFWRDSVGFADPQDPADAARMREQSPLMFVERVRTPVLMESGVRDSGGMDDGVLPFFQGVVRAGTPTEYVRYPRTGHGITEPRLRVESASRVLEWFDYWLRGAATPRMLARFGSRGSASPAAPRQAP